MRRSLIAVAGLLSLALYSSCRMISSFVHDGEVVAKIGEHRLYRTDMEGVIPKDVSPEDSLALAKAYITSWAKNMAFMDIAAAELSKDEKDVAAELEAYRQSLLRYRYEQHYINERLDTSVSESIVDEYYDAHKDEFRLPRPIFKARFMVLPQDSPDLPVIKKLMASGDVEDVMAADSLAFRATSHYHDFSGGWIDASVLSAEFGIDHSQMLSRKEGNIIQMPFGEDVAVAFIIDMVKAGEIPPVAYCRERIIDIIIAGRKHDLLMTLEQDLLEEARSNDQFVIY